VTIFALLLLSLHAAGSSRLQVRDLLDYEHVGDSKSPSDGREVIYTRHWVNQQTGGSLDRPATAIFCSMEVAPD
jgi:hypothetical protein